MKYKVVNQSNSLDFGQFKPILSSFLKYATKRMGFQKPPSLFFMSDIDNAQLPLGKTAHYDPSNMGVTVYTDGRHPKDILRSLSHELVHHKQNCDGQFDQMGEMGEGYAQNDKHLFEWKNAEMASLIREKFNIPEAKVEEEADMAPADTLEEDSGEEESEHYDRNVEHDDDHISAIRHHLDALEHDKDYEEEHVDEGGLANRKGDPRQRRPEASPMREEEEESEKGKKREKASFASTKATFGSKARDRQRDRASRPATARVFGGVSEEDQSLDEAKIRKALKQFVKR